MRTLFGVLIFYLYFCIMLKTKSKMKQEDKDLSIALDILKDKLNKQGYVE